MKYCTKCGKENSDSAAFCEVCGTTFVPSAATAPTAAGAETSGMAVASLICGCLFFFLPTAIVAVILGHLSRSQIRKSGGRLKGSGLAVTGLVLGYMGVAIIPILVLAAIVIPNLLRSRIAANEAAAIGSLRTIASAALAYDSKYGAGFPPSLESLGPGPNGAQPSETAADLIDAQLASGQKAGYTFRYEAGVSGDGNFKNEFMVHADPVVENQTGTAHYFVDQSGVIRGWRNAPANGDSPPLHPPR